VGGAGGNGGDSYASDGIESHIYLNYGVVETYNTSCDMFAAGGATGGAAITVIAKLTGNQNQDSPSVTVSAAISGAGGSGIPAGQTGSATDYYMYRLFFCFCSGVSEVIFSH
jgi:hypothetical protein